MGKGFERTARSRSALWYGLGTFVALELVMALALEVGSPLLRNPDFYLKSAALLQRISENEAGTPTIVMLGSSRTTLGLNGSFIEGDLAPVLGQAPIVFNFGEWAAGPASELLILQDLVQRSTQVDLLLIEVVPGFLNDRAVLDPHVCNADRLGLRELRTLKECGAPTAQLRREWLENLPVPWYARRFAILSLLAPKLVPDQVRLGWADVHDRSCWLPPAERVDEAARRSAIQGYFESYGRRLADFHLGGPCCVALRQILETCRKKQIPAALVLMPEGSQFRSWYSADGWSQICHFLNDLSREFAAPIVNCRDWVDDDDFSDQHHMLLHGSEVFSHRFGREVILPLLQRQHDGCNAAANVVPSL